ncbi:hypothetical protein [Methylobacterium sp. J-068]|uniref:hypothetical protein n=1 Tax=Methylobacterium sp. J-068 TaxID=2836649 RepID=UPI001FBAF103|nr:hypothetical protein [Methylobacterium sp. J-068]MCJ2036587.1 hypothetical protein [Methylobacterium sp. J-068]
MSEMQRWVQPGKAAEARNLRLLLAVLRTETKLIRLRRSLSRKYSSDQPRAPAGQSDGGRWVSQGGDSGGPLIDQLPHRSGRWASLDAAEPGSEAPQRTLLDGGEVLTLRVRSGRSDWEEQHKVVTPEGESRIFENSGETQTIRDGHSGEVLSRTTFSSSGIAAEATVQPAFLPAAPLIGAAAAAAANATFEAVALLFTVLAARHRGFGPALGMTARSYEIDPKSKSEIPTPIIKDLRSDEFARACPRFGEILQVTNRITAEVKAEFPDLKGKELGTLVHYRIAQFFSKPPDPNFRVEFSLDRSGVEVNYGNKYSVRLDVFELTPENMVCVYDFKVGNEGLSAPRALELYNAAKKYHPSADGFVLVQVRPET